MDKFIEVALVTRPQGIKGELRLNVLLNSRDDIFKLSEFYFEGIDKPFKATEFKKVSDDVSVKLEGINSIEEASAFVQKKLLCSRKEVDKLKGSDDLYVEDLIGKSAILNSGEFIGIIDDIENFGASDVVFIRSPKFHNLSFANVGGIILKLDQEKQEVILDAEEFKKYCVYDEQDEN